MIARVKSTGEIIKDVKVYERDPNLVPITYIGYTTNAIYKADDLEIGCDEPIELLTEQKMYDDYQERSITAGNRAEQLAWAFIVILCAQLIGSEHFREPYVIAAGGIAYMLLSSLQALWQAFAMWLFKNRVKRLGLAVDDYPQWLGGTAWVIYWAKMVVIAVTSVYAVWHFVRLL